MDWVERYEALEQQNAQLLAQIATQDQRIAEFKQVVQAARDLRDYDEDMNEHDNSTWRALDAALKVSDSTKAPR